MTNEEEDEENTELRLQIWIMWLKYNTSLGDTPSFYRFKSLIFLCFKTTVLIFTALFELSPKTNLKNEMFTYLGLF